MITYVYINIYIYIYIYIYTTCVCVNVCVCVCVCVYVCVGVCVCVLVIYNFFLRNGLQQITNASFKKGWYIYYRKKSLKCEFKYRPTN